MSTLLGNYVDAVPAQQRLGPRWFAGSADAIYQSLNLIDDEQPELRHRLRRRPHLPDGPAADGRPSTSSSGAGVTVAGIRQPLSLADQFGVIETGDDGQPHRRVPREADRRDRPAPTPRTRSTPRWATTSSRTDVAARRAAPGTPWTRRASTTWAATSSRCSSSSGEAQRLRLPRQRRARLHRARPRLLARRRDARLVLRRAHGPDRRRTRSSTSTTTSGRSTPTHDPLPPAKFVHGEEGRIGRAIDSMVSPGAVISGCAGRGLGAVAERATCTRGRRSPARC